MPIGRFLMVIGQLALIAVCAIFIKYQYTADIHPDQEARNTFQQSNCLVVSKKLSIVGGYAQLYRADFLIHYNVDGVQYNHWVSGNGLDKSYGFRRSTQEDLLAQYQEGETYSCWYDSDQPQVSILLLRHDWYSFLLLLMAGFVGLMAAYFLSNTRLSTP